MTIMQKLTQNEFELLLEQQKACTGTQNVRDHEVTSADLSGLRLDDRDLSGSAIALSHFPSMHLTAQADLYGVSWIGNQLDNCVFDGVSMNKAQLIDCELSNCMLRAVSLLRADFTGTTFRRCRLVDLDLTQKSSLFGVAFLDCEFSNVKFDDGRLVTGAGSLSFGDDGSVLDDQVALG